MSVPTIQVADAAALLKANRRGILAMTAAMACFIGNDSLVKYASQSMPTAQLNSVTAGTTLLASEWKGFAGT